MAPSFVFVVYVSSPLPLALRVFSFFVAFSTLTASFEREGLEKELHFARDIRLIRYSLHPTPAGPQESFKTLEPTKNFSV